MGRSCNIYCPNEALFKYGDKYWKEEDAKHMYSLCKHRPGLMLVKPQ